MSNRLRWAARLYPKAWRERYGDEFEAFLEDVNPSWRDLPDIVKGAFEMQMKGWTFAKVTAGFALLGLAVAGVIAIRTPNTYVSTAVMKFTPPPATNPADAAQQLSQRLNLAQQEVLSRGSLASLIQDTRIYSGELTREPLEDVVQEMRNRAIAVRILDMSKDPNALGVSVQFRYTDPAKAQLVTNELVTRLRDTAARSASGPGKLELLERASSPGKRSPNRAAIVAAGVAIGLLAGALVFGIGRWPKIAAVGLTGAFGGLLVAYAIPNRYVSTAVVWLPNTEAAQDLEQKTLGDSAWIQSVIQELQLSTDAERMRRDLRVHALNIPHTVQRTAVAISFEYTGDRSKAQEVVATTVARWIQLTVGPASPVEVLDPASYPERPFAPNRPVVVFLGLLAGVILGSVWRIRNRFRPPALTHA